MKELLKRRISPVMIVMLVAIIIFMIEGCEQAADIVQNAQNVTPVASDFTVTGLTATADGGSKAVSIKPKTGKSQGVITIYYEGINGSFYSKRVNAPSAAGKYAVTFDVAAADGFNAANGLKAGTLTINAMTAGGNESEDEDTDDDYADEGGVEEDYHEDVEFTEEIFEPLSLIDFEGNEWAGKGYTLYKNRKVTFKGHEWSVSGVTKMGASDHYIGSGGIRFRGTDDDIDNINRLELVTYLTDGIESISFDYASYGKHKNGIIELYYQKEDENWVKAGEVTAPLWTIENNMQNAVFFINETGNIRFKIEKVNVKGKTASTSVNIDNILITTY